MSVAPAPVAAPVEGDVAYASLWLADVERARAFYGALLGWTFGSAAGPGSTPVEGMTPPQGLFPHTGHPTLFLAYTVDDIDAAAARVEAAGGRVERRADEPYGRIADCVDDQGTSFALHQSTGGSRVPQHGTNHGDIAYITMEVIDVQRTRAFYGAVLGWRFAPGSSAGGWQVPAVAPMVGLSGGHAEHTAIPMYRVSDIEAAVEKVRALGGSATDPVVRPYGIESTCVDDQGMRFYLGDLS